jgi:hypothetical protein
LSNEIVLQLDPTPYNARNSEAAFVTLSSGRILLAWSKFVGGDYSDFGSGIIAARYSDDGGRTWSRDDTVLVDQEGTTNVMSPSLLRLQDGRIALLNLRKDGHKVCMPYIRFSEDECRSFSPAVQVIPEPGYYVVNNDRVVQLSGGRLIVPVAYHRMRGPSELQYDALLPGENRSITPRAEPLFAMAALIFYYFSDDGGRTWLESLTSYYRCFADGCGLLEPGLIELNDGRLWSWTRTGPITHEVRDYRQWSSLSDDGGQVWSEPEPSCFVSPSSPLQVKRMPQTGHLLAVWNDHSARFSLPRPEPISWGRTPLVSAISKDEGSTWEHFKLLEAAPDHGFCYPAVHFADDAALLSYNAGGASSKTPLDTQRVRRITLDELYG